MLTTGFLVFAIVVAVAGLALDEFDYASEDVCKEPPACPH